MKEYIFFIEIDGKKNTLRLNKKYRNIIFKRKQKRNKREKDNFVEVTEEY